MRSPRKLTPEQERLIIERYRKGETPSSIWKSFEISKRSFYNTLQRQNAAPLRAQVRLSTREELAVVARYRRGEPARSISDSTGISYQTVYNMLERNKVDVRLPMTRLDEADRLRVVETCRAGSNANEAAKTFGISPETVFTILSEHGVSLPHGRPRCCTIDDAAFDASTVDSRYFCGFIFSDGCVHQDKYGSPVLALGLADKDRGHLEKLRTFLKSTHKIGLAQKTKTSMGGPFATYRVRSKQICATLGTLGIVKKRTRVPVSILADSRDFWRGCIDGDGSIGMWHNEPQIRLSGQRPILETYLAFLAKNGLTASTGIVLAGERTGTVWEVEAWGPRAFAIIDALYRGAPSTAVLDRKNARAIELLAGRTEAFPAYVDYYEGPSRVQIGRDVIAELLADESEDA